MNDEHRPVDFEDLEPPLKAALAALASLAAPAEPIPDDAIERVKARAKRLATTAVSPSRASGSRYRGWKAARYIIGGLAATAALLALTIGAVSLLNHSGGPAFAQMVEKVKAASSVRFATATQFGKQPEIKGVMYLEGNRMRMEQFDGTLIDVGDFDRKLGLLLDMHGKTVQLMEIDADVARRFANPIDQLRRAKSDDAESIGEESLKGRRTHVYRVRKAGLFGITGAEMLVWVDGESGLPAKIVIRNSDPKAGMEFRFDEFVWNEPLDARLFSLALPEGFQTGVVMKTPSPKKATQGPTALPDNPDYPADGVLCRDRVPAYIVWGPQGKTITALLRDPESAAPQEWREHELRQWDATTGKLRWSASVGGAGWLAQTADGKTLAIVIGYEVQLRDAASGTIVRKWTADEHLSPLAFSPDGKTLATGIAEWGRYGGKGGKESGGAQFWDVERASLLRSISDDKPVTFVRYSVDGKHLATSSNDGPVKWWDATTGELPRIFPGRGRADFSPDGHSIACPSIASSADKTIGRIDLLNLRDGSLVKPFAGEKGATASWLLCVTFSPDGRLLAATDWNGTVTVWDVVSGQRKHTLADHRAGALAAAFSPDGTRLATGSEDKTLRVRKLPAETIRPAPEKTGG